MPENLEIYNAVRYVPNEAKKTITGGRLNGMTDINPMWRIKMLTEQFGPCGFGWWYEITKQWIEPGASGEMMAFCNINLYVSGSKRLDIPSWSQPISGTGGSVFVANEKSGLRTNDEAFKMALTDAISVACKALGFGADVYWDKDRTKYDAKPAPAPAPAPTEPEFDQELETAIADLKAAKSRKEVADINKRYREIYGTYSSLPNPRYIDVLREMSKKYPKPTATLNK